MGLLISSSDKSIIRDAAKKQLELANKDSMRELKKEWVRHNDCIAGRPMVTVEWGTFEQEVFPTLLKCKGKLARTIEKQIISNYVGSELFKDDSVVNSYVGMPTISWFKPFGIKVKTDVIKGSVSHHFHEVLHDLGEDFALLKKSTYGILNTASAIMKNYVNNLVGDILPVKYVGRSLYAVPTQSIVHLMSMENLMFNLYDYPDEFHKMMDMLSNDYIEYFKYLENKNFLLPTAEAEWVGQGTYAFTNDLPSADMLKGKQVKINNVWGFMDSQETTTISPDMYEEFIFPYYKRISDMFGLFSYGCCEPIDPIWNNCISKMENLRKVSISPWCNEEYMGEQLEGRRIVYHRKPSPNYLGVDKTLNTEELEKHIKRTINATKGRCNVEFTQRDVYTVHNNMDKVREYVRIIRELSAN